MKRIILSTAILILLVFSIPTKAQVSVNINIGSQPLWGLAGYDHVDYYYIPAIDAYYDVSTGQYIFLNNGRWVFNRNLPPAYSNFNLYNAYKVVVNQPKPYLHHNIYVSKYGKYKNWSGKQSLIRDSRDNRYSVVKGHPLYRGGRSNQPSRSNREQLRPGNDRIKRPNDNRGNRTERGRQDEGNRPGRN